MSEQDKYIGESKIGERPLKVLSIKLTDNSVVTDKIADKAVTKDKLANESVSVRTFDEDALLMIQSIERGQLALAQELGSSEVIGISQKVLTQEIVGLQEDVAYIQGNYYAS